MQQMYLDSLDGPRVQGEPAAGRFQEQNRGLDSLDMTKRHSFERWSSEVIKTSGNVAEWFTWKVIWAIVLCGAVQMGDREKKTKNVAWAQHCETNYSQKLSKHTRTHKVQHIKWSTCAPKHDLMHDVICKMFTSDSMPTGQSIVSPVMTVAMELV